VFAAQGFPQRVVFGEVVEPPADIAATEESGRRQSYPLKGCYNMELLKICLYFYCMDLIVLV